MGETREREREMVAAQSLQEKNKQRHFQTEKNFENIFVYEHKE